MAKNVSEAEGRAELSDLVVLIRRGGCSAEQMSTHVRQAVVFLIGLELERFKREERARRDQEQQQPTRGITLRDTDEGETP